VCSNSKSEAIRLTNVFCHDSALICIFEDSKLRLLFTKCPFPIWWPSLKATAIFFLHILRNASNNSDLHKFYDKINKKYVVKAFNVYRYYTSAPGPLYPHLSLCIHCWSTRLEMVFEKVILTDTSMRVEVRGVKAHTLNKNIKGS